MSINRKDLIATAVSGMLIVLFCFYYSADRDYSIIHRICDGCFVTGVMLTGAGLILHCANKGAFNLFGYSAKFGMNLIMPFIGKNPWLGDRDRETYYEYCMRKAEEGPKPVSHLLIVGGAYLAVAAVCLVIYLLV